MKKLKETLWADYEAVKKEIGNCADDQTKYKLLLEKEDNIRNELLKLEQMNNEKLVKESQIESENKREKVRNYINVGTFAVSTCVSVIGLYKTFEFDKTATVTSTLGRPILNGVVPKIFKR